MQKLPPTLRQWAIKLVFTIALLVVWPLLSPPSSAAAPAAAVPTLAGSWSGRMEPANLSARLDLTLLPPAADATGAVGWTAELKFRAGPDSSVLPIGELRVEDEAVRITTSLEGAAISIDLRLDDGILLGTAHVTEGERVLADGPVGLARTGDAEGQARLTQWLDAQGTAIDAVQRQAVIDRAGELFLANYVFQDEAELAVAGMRARAQRGEYDAVTTAARLAELLSQQLAEATGDRHVHVKFSAERVPDPLAGIDAAETSAELAKLRQDAAAESFGIGPPRILDGNVGYLQFTRFFRADIAGDALATAMQQLAATDELIIDLRECHGGDPGMAVLAASWLIPAPARHWNDLLRRFDHTDRQFWTAAWLPGPRFVGKPVYVLTAQGTFSAPESLAYELQQTGRARVVGGTTGGGAHPGVWFPIDGHFAIFIPLSRYVSAVSGGDWEGTGVVPDVACPAEEALEKALQLIATARVT